MNLHSDTATDTKKEDCSALSLLAAEELDMDKGSIQRFLYLVKILAKDCALSEETRRDMVDILYGQTVSLIRVLQ